MKLLILGRGKTGSPVAEVAGERKHEVHVLGSADNVKASALTPAALARFDVVIDFTSPHAVLDNIAACVVARKNVVVGTTGWHRELPRIREMIEKSGTGFLYAANFSIGINLFYEVTRTAAAALQHDYFGQIFERHHAHKKDAPSGTAIALQGIIKETSGRDVEIVSFREGEVVGMHEIVFDSAADSIYLCHDAKSRRGFAEGAVRGAEWLVGKSGFYNFKDIWREL